MARRERSFFFNNKTGELKSKGKTLVDATNSANIAQTKGSTAGNPVALIAEGDDTNIDIRITPKGSGNVEILAPLEILTGKRILDSAGTNVEFGDNIEMNSNKITGLGTPTASSDASTKAYVDTTVGDYLPLTGGTISSNLTVSGNFTVNGTTTTINTSTLSVADNLIDLNSDVTSGTPSQDAGIRILRGDSNAVQLRWNETNDKWELTTDGASYTNIAVTSDIPTAVSDLTNDSGYITSYTVTEGDVTAHQAALSITESQISDLGTYLTASDITGKLNLSGGTMSGAIAMGTNKITGMGDPTANQDAATKAYVDSQVSSVPTGDITSVTASTGLTGGGTTGDVTLSIDSTVATLTGTQTLTNKTLTAPVISSISNTGTLTLPTSTGTVALTSDIPTNVSELTNDSGYSTTTGTVTSVAGTGTVNGLTLSGTVTSSGSLTLGGTFTATVSEISDLTATAAELNILDGVTATTTEINYLDGVTSAIQTQIDNISSSFTLAADSGTSDTFTTGQTLTIAGGTGVDTTVTDNQISVAIDSTVATLTGTQTLTNKTLTAPVISSISNTGTLTLPTSTGTVALTSDIPTNNNQLTNGAGYITGYTVTESDVTTHQAALSITESQISDLGAYATLASPTLTGTPAAPTATAGTNTTQIATTAFVSTAVANIVDTAPEALNTLNELAAALGDDANFATTTATSLGEKLAKASNLSDLTNAATARTNLGLGTAATTAATAYATAAQGTKADTAHGWGNHASAGYLTSYTETNDLSAAVTWANVPDANITQSSVTQHQAALSITESQISDLSHTTSLAFSAITSTPTTLSGYGITDAVASSAISTFGGTLVDDADAAAARTTLGLGTAATTASTDYATAAQGTKADTAHGWGNHASAGYLTSFTETTTTLTSDSVNQRLQYTDETGTTNNIDLSWAVDDSNLARITSGSVNGGTGVATFTRDDASTFTVDFSALFDDTNLTRITSAAFNTTTGVLTLTRSDATTVTVDLDGRYLTGYTVTQGDVTAHQAALSITESQISDLQSYLTAVSESDVTQHQAALSITESQISDLGSYITASSTDTLTNKTLTSPEVNTSIDLKTQADIRFYDSDNSNYVGFQAPATATGNILWTLPGSDGTEGQVLSTSGGGTLTWEDPGSGGGSGSSYPNSTFSTVPGTNGNFDMSKNVGQTVTETPFESGGTDAFGVNLGSVFSLMDPIGSLESIDYGSGESYVGA